MLELKALRKSFGALAAADGVTLEVRPGEVHALIGPNGAGKTTLVGLVAGTLAPESGEVLFEGRDITALSAHERVHAGLARSYQVTSVFPEFTVEENLALAVQARTGSSFSFWRPVAAEQALFAQARAVATQVGLGERAGLPARALSHGERRALEVGLGLATGARLLLLDEPMAGMGPEDSRRMVELIAALRGRVTVLLVEHDMDAVFRLADHISVLVAGRVIATGAPDEIRANPQVRSAYLGEELAA